MQIEAKDNGLVKIVCGKEWYEYNNDEMFSGCVYNNMRHLFVWTQLPESLVLVLCLYNNGFCGDKPAIELFARQKTEGWDVWGNEVESDIDLTCLVTIRSVE